MEPKQYARSVWFAISVFFAVMVLRCWQIANVNPYPPGYQGTRCGEGVIVFLFGMMVFGGLGLISLAVFFTRKKQ